MERADSVTVQLKNELLYIIRKKPAVFRLTRRVCRIYGRGGGEMTDGVQNALLQNLERLHTTPMGIERIRRNLSLSESDVAAWCRDRISDSRAMISRHGKNWYVKLDDCIITVNAYSYTIITAHRP